MDWIHKSLSLLRPSLQKLSPWQVEGVTVWQKVTRATQVADKIKKGSIYRWLLERDGVNIVETSSPSYLQRASVEDAMTTDVDTVGPNQTLVRLIELFDSTDHNGFPVVDEEGKLVGIVTNEDMHRISTDMKFDDFLVKNIMTPNPKIVRPGDNLHTAIIRLYEFKIGRLPFRYGWH